MTAPLLDRTVGPAAPAGQVAPVDQTASHPADGSVRSVGRFVWRPVEIAPLPTAVSPLLTGRRVAVLGGGEDQADRLLVQLRQAGAAPFRLEPCQPGEADASVAGFWSALQAAGCRGLDGIIDLNVQQSLDLTGPDGWEPAFLQTLALLRSCYPDWTTETDANRLCYVPVTRLGGRMGFADGPVPQPLGGLWAGLAKGLPREVPNVNIRVLDVSEGDQEDLATLVCRELYRWGEFEVGYHGGRRFTLVAERAPVAPPSHTLEPDDVVVMSGGGRGIGFALARALASNFGCRVVVSGRAAPPDPDAEVVRLSDSQFDGYRRQRLSEAARHRRLPAVRAELEALAKTRELASNLAGARSAGLDISYCQADVSQPADVERLLEFAGPRLVGVVHDAGVDLPSRLPEKTAGQVATVVSVKVGGFFNLSAAVQDGAPLKFFCSVGSLTGRWGGMTGQLDYGAANEALSRLGLWATQPTPQAGRARRLPVSTVCWPTWDRVGMITNYDATLQYMSAMSIPEGLDRWQRELLAGDPGERTFIGEVGPAMLPSILLGYQQDAALRDIERLVTMRFLLGRPVSFQPHGSIASENLLRADQLPGCTDFCVDGLPTVPVSLALELLLSTGDWLAPEPAVHLRPVRIEDVTIDLQGLRMTGPGGELRLRKEAAASWHVDGTWRVRATLSVVDPETAAQVVARGELVYAKGRPPAIDCPAPPAQLFDREQHLELPARLSWAGRVLRLSGYARHPETGSWWAHVEQDRMADLTVTTPSPRARLPHNQVENVVRAVYLSGPDRIGADSPTRLTVAAIELDLDADADANGWVCGTADGRQWDCLTGSGRARLRFRRPGFSGPTSPPDSSDTDAPDGRPAA